MRARSCSVAVDVDSTPKKNANLFSNFSSHPFPGPAFLIYRVFLDLIKP